MKEASQKKYGHQVVATLAEARTGLFRATLLFGSIAAALALIVVPAADRHAKHVASERSGGVDRTITGSISDPSAQRYVLRRSVLDESSSGPCLLFPNGTQRGAC